MAARYLTIVPIPGAASSNEGPGAAAAWFPVVGLAIGVLLSFVDRLGAAVFAPLLAAALTVTAWALVTGGLHLDGLADCFDGLIGRDADHRLAIMRDSRVGAFGAIALVLFLALEIGCVSGIDRPARWRALLAAPVLGRAMPPLIGRVFGAVAKGHGASFGADLGAAAPVAAGAFALVVLIAILGVLGAVSCVLGGAVALVWAAFMARRLGGISGDVHGATIQLTELAVLLTVAAAYPAR